VRNSPFMTPATKAQLVAAVGIRDAAAGRSPAHFLRDHVTGGSRGNKPLELAMQRMGALPPGWLVVPSSNGVKLDAFGNVPKATVARILQALATGTTARRGADTFRVFAVRPGEQNPRTRHLAPGVWSVSRVAGETVLQLVFLFVR